MDELERDFRQSTMGGRDVEPRNLETYLNWLNTQETQTGCALKELNILFARLTGTQLHELLQTQPKAVIASGRRSGRKGGHTMHLGLDTDGNMISLSDGSQGPITVAEGVRLHTIIFQQKG